MRKENSSYFYCHFFIFVSLYMKCSFLMPFCVTGIQSLTGALGDLCSVIMVFPLYLYTDNPLYTDTRYNDKICYNDNLTVKKPLLNK